jgi:hypothetical protein
MSTRPRIWIGLGVVLTACGLPIASPTVRPDGSPHIEPAPSATSSQTQRPTPSVGQPASPQPSATAATAALDRDSVAEVVRDGLQVLRGPGSGYGQVEAWLTRLSGLEPAGVPYVLIAGERLFIQDGPIHIEDADWYSVRPAELLSLGDAFFTEGWVALREADGPYLEPRATRDRSCCYSAAGTGDATIEVPPLVPCAGPGPCSRAMAWVAGLADPAATCRIRITQDRTATVIVDQRIEGWGRGAAWWPEQAESAIFVETDCSWSVHVGPA